MADLQTLFGKRYSVQHLIGEGAMGAVYSATDRLTGQTVAIKRVNVPGDQVTFDARDSTNMHVVLAHEFQTLASLRHPHIISVLDYGFDTERRPYFTMTQLVEPQTIKQAGHGQPLVRQISLLTQMLQALAYLHQRRILHRDLKPENVLVVDGQVKLLDFGLSVAVEKADEPVGTLAYIAPEIITGGGASIATDLYAAGVIVYELLIGRLPFYSDSIDEMMDMIVDRPPDLSDLNVSTRKIDARIADVVRTLLAKKPSERYASASEVIRALSEAASQPLPTETRATRESFLQAARMVERESELTRLLAALSEATERRRSALWLVGGESGVGKSRLLDELRTRALVLGVPVLRGEAVEQGSSPFQLWREPLRLLALSTAVTPSEAALLQLLIPDIGDLTDQPVSPAPGLVPHAAQNQLMSTVAELFRRHTEPLLLILEDVQWAGSESRALLTYLDGALRDRPLLIVASYRDDAAIKLTELLPDAQRLKLSRLTNDGIAALSESMLGQVGRQPQVLDLLQRETEGNVFFVVEVVRALADEAGQLDKIGAITLPASVFAGGMKRILQARLDRVPPDARPLLESAAALGRGLDLRILRAAAPEVDLDAWLAACASAAVLEVQDDQWRFAHDKLRESLLAELAPDARRALHVRAGRAIELAYPNARDLQQKAAALAYQWGMAENPAKERHYAMAAGERALAINAAYEALAFFERALTLLDADARLTDRERAFSGARIAHRMGNVYENLSAYKDAEAAYERGLSLARQAGDRHGEALNLTDLAAIYRNTGRTGDAMQYLEVALIVHHDVGDRVYEAMTLSFMGMVYRDQGQTAKAISAFEQALALHGARGDSYQESFALRFLGNAFHDLGQFERAVDFFERALIRERQLGNRRGESFALGSLGNTALELGDTDAAYRYNQESLAINTDIGNKRGQCYDLLALGRVDMLVGEYERAEQTLRQALEIAQAVGSPELIHKNASALAQVFLHTQRLSAALDAITLALDNPFPSINHHAYALHGIIQARLGDGETAEAGFSVALAEADALRVQSPGYYAVLYTRGLALAGLTVLRPAYQRDFSAVETAYQEALASCSAIGVVERARHLLETLEPLDPNGALALLL